MGCLVRYPPADVTSFNTALLLRLCTVSLLLHVRPSAVCSAFVRFAPHIGPPRLQTITMKISAAIALVAVGGASAYSVDRSSLRSLGQKSIGTNSARSHARSNDIKMEGECTWARRFDLFHVAHPPAPPTAFPTPIPHVVSSTIFPAIIIIIIFIVKTSNSRLRSPQGYRVRLRGPVGGQPVHLGGRSRGIPREGRPALPPEQDPRRSRPVRAALRPARFHRGPPPHRQDLPRPPPR